MSASTFKSCLRDGCGPSVKRLRRKRWQPWRYVEVVECWVCATPLDEAEAAAADKRWSWIGDRDEREITGGGS